MATEFEKLMHVALLDFQSKWGKNIQILENFVPINI